MKGVTSPRIVVLRPPRERSDLTFGLGTECSIDSKPTKIIQRLRRVFLLEALALLGADPHTLRGVRLGIAWLCDGCCTSIPVDGNSSQQPIAVTSVHQDLSHILAWTCRYPSVHKPVRSGTVTSCHVPKTAVKRVREVVPAGT